MSEVSPSEDLLDKQKHEKGAKVLPTEPLNLRKPFPIAFRSVFRRSILWILGFIILISILMALDNLRPAEESIATKIFLLSCLAFIIVGLLLVTGKLIYELLYYHIYYYGIELEHLVISRGLIFKTRASFPITHLSDVYLHQSPIDLIFRISNLRVTTHSPVAEFGAIEGLVQGRAIALQNLLLALANTTTSSVDMESATDSLKTMQATDEPSVFGASPAVKDPPRMSEEMVPDSLKQSPPEEGSVVAKPEDLLSELQQTKHLLEETRDELIHAEELLEKTQNTLENALSAKEQGRVA